MRYQFIKEHQNQFRLAALCRVMAVGRSGFYAWGKRGKSVRTQQNDLLTEQIQTAFDQSEQTYGSPRVFVQLKADGIACSQKRVARLMRLNGLRAVPARRCVVTTDSAHALPIAANVLDRQFHAEAPNTKWTADITYIWTGEGWLYLAVVLDLFSRRIVGWAMEPTLESRLVVSALEMALTGRKPGAGLLCHSDRGSQYAGSDYQKQLAEAGIVCSMSRKGNCWDNAPTESFFATLKKEKVYRTSFATRTQARGVLFAWIEVWYNRTRRHSTLGSMSPSAFEAAYRPLPAALAA